MSIFENSRDEVYELAYYTIPNEVTGAPVHKKINMKVSRDLLGNAVATSIYGTWRRAGFWTEKEFSAEEPVNELIQKIDNLFDANVITDDKKFFEAKQKMSKLVESTFKDVMIPEKKAKLIQHIPYGVDHNALAITEPPVQGRC